MKDAWERQAGLELRALMNRAGVSYAELADELESYGEQLTSASLTKKVYRGAFTLAFFLKCAAAVQHLAHRHGAVAPPIVVSFDTRGAAQQSEELAP